MTCKLKTAENIRIMEAFQKGEKIQFKALRGGKEVWLDTNDPSWDFLHLEFRVRPVKDEHIPYKLLIKLEFGSFSMEANNNKDLIVKPNYTSDEVLIEECGENMRNFLRDLTNYLEGKDGQPE